MMYVGDRKNSKQNTEDRTQKTEALVFILYATFYILYSLL